MGAGAELQPVARMSGQVPTNDAASLNKMPATLAEYQAQQNNGQAMTAAVKPWAGTVDANNIWSPNTPEQAAAAYAKMAAESNSGLNQIGGYSGPAGTGGLSSLTQQPNTSNPNTPTLGTGQTANPYMGSTNPYIQAAQATTMGNLYGAQAATQANRINQNTPYGSLNYTQGVDQYGNPTWTANQQLSQPLQDLTNTSLQGLQQSLQNPAYGINPGQTYSDAIMQRLQPQLAQQAESNTAALANQGIVPGTKAYENAMRTFQQGQNDLLTSAQIQGMNTGLQAQQLQNTQAANIKSLSSPNYINPYTQAAVSGPDYLGAYTTSNAAQIAAQNAQNAKTANLQNGLFGLGNAALLGSGGLGSLGTNGTGGTGLLGLGSSAYNALFGNTATPGLGQTTNWLGQVITDPTYGQGGSAVDYASQLGDAGNLLGI